MITNEDRTITFPADEAQEIAIALRRQIETLRDFPRKNSARLCVLRTALARLQNRHGVRVQLADPEA